MSADENKTKAIAVILSGTGKDGVEGTAAIKKEGGLVIVQAPESCTFPFMPQQIIDGGQADYILCPEDMPAVIQGYANRPITTA